MLIEHSFHALSKIIYPFLYDGIMVINPFLLGIFPLVRGCHTIFIPQRNTSHGLEVPEIDQF